METGEPAAVVSKWRLGVVKFYLPKFARYFVHMFSLEEGFTEFASLPKAQKEVSHWVISGTLTSVDFSRVCKDRFWIGPAEFSKVQLLSMVPVWTRPAPSEMIKDEVLGENDWLQCAECEYLIEGEEHVTCMCCHAKYHSDCLFGYEKLARPEYDPDSLDKQGRCYLAALRKWKARKTSKNPSLVLEDEDLEGKEEEVVASSLATAFVCVNCRSCRYCCSPVLEEVIPSGSNLPSVEPWVVCRSCNSASHGSCVFPPVPKLHASVEYVCDDCRECNSCGRVTYLIDQAGMPSPLTDWALPSFDQCKQCFAGLDRGEYCPVCMKAWSMEWGGDMIQCDGCEFWVHCDCDNLGSMGTGKLSHATVKYNCPICRDSTDVHRRRRLIDLLRAIDKVGLFAEPVSASFMPVYLKVIRNPMDLSKMRVKNESVASYDSNLSFIKDFELIVENAKIFNMPNSPAYRLAEQFHKQGRLLVEKYLLADRKGASKIEGLQIDTEMLEEGEGAAGKRAASLVAEKNWQKKFEIARKRKVATYGDALDLIKRMEKGAGQAVGKGSGQGEPPTEGGGLISPYRRKLGKLHSPVDSSTSEGSRLASPQTPPVSSMSEMDIDEVLMGILEFTSKHFLEKKANLWEEDAKNNFYAPFQILPGDFSRILAGPYSSEWSKEAKTALNTELGLNARFTLYDCCSSCGGFGESWNLVECAECGDAAHFYCAGLVAHPGESLTSSSLSSLSCLNPLLPSQPAHRRYLCKLCVKCRVCERNGVGEPGCSLCGCVMHAECGVKSFGLDLTVDHSAVRPICPDCVLSQSLSFFRANSCATCETPINPNLAAMYLQAVGSSEAPAFLTQRSSPLVHCVSCGACWHARCISEFSDISSVDILGIYTCGACAVAPPRVKADEVLAIMGECLKQFRQLAYVEMQTDLLKEIVRSWGLPNTARGGDLVTDVIDLFGGGTAFSDSSFSTPLSSLSEEERAWIEWGLVHRDFLLGLGNPLAEVKKPAVSPSVDPPLNGGVVSVKVKRSEDEDLLFVKRLYALFHLLRGADSEVKEEERVGMVTPLGRFPDVLDSSPHSEEPTIELGAKTLQLWLAKYGESSGYIGPGIAARKQPCVFPVAETAVPSWDVRKCELCQGFGDHVVFGILLPCSISQFVHAECLAWSDPRTPVPGIEGCVHWRFGIPVASEEAGRERAPPFFVYEGSDVTANLVRSECAVCASPGATVRCQQCNETSFHLGCALRANGNSLMMDSRCRLLTCERCLTSESRIFFVSQFRAITLTASQSAVNQIQVQRQQVTVRQAASVGAQFPFPLWGNKIIAREGPLAIVNEGKLAGVYDGSAQLVPVGFISTRLFWTVDWALTHEDDAFMKSVIGSGAANGRAELAVLKRKRKTVYVCKVSGCGKKIFSIEIMGGRLVAVGHSLAEVWAEFQCMFRGLASRQSGSWFFGFESQFMKHQLRAIALKSVRTQAGLHREKWVYQPQLRAKLTKLLSLDADLKPVTSWRRDLQGMGATGKLGIDQLASLGRIVSAQPRSGTVKLVYQAFLEPALVLAERRAVGEEKLSRTKQAVLDSSMSSKYKVRSLTPDADLLVVKRSRIHNYGLFAKGGFAKGDLVVEYQGEILRQTIADEREKRAERQGNGDGGSCYMFKLDDDFVVDATVKGNCARFINHSCNPNCTCKMVEDDQHKKHIMIVAKRDIPQNEEITYDYQFAVESEKLACLCGAPNCLGRLN